MDTILQCQSITKLSIEPTGNLDSKNSQIVFDIFKHIVKKQNHNMVTVTHDANLSRQTQRQARIVDGMIENG